MNGTGVAATSALAMLLGTMAGEPVRGQQLLEEWTLLHSAREYDTLVTGHGLERVGSLPDGANVIRVIASRMLVRHIDDARRALIETRTRNRMDVRGYDRYVSSTYVFELQCTARRVALRQTVDYDETGRELDRREVEGAWLGVPAGWEDRAAAALIDWACRSARASYVGLVVDRGREALDSQRR